MTLRNVFLALLLGCFGGMSASATANGEHGSDMRHADWSLYAEAVNAQVSAWLSTIDQDAITLRALIDAKRADPNTPSPEYEMRLWISPKGLIERAIFQGLGANADLALNKVLAGRQLTEGPPAGAPMPLRLAIQLQAPNDGVSTAPAG